MLNKQREWSLVQKNLINNAAIFLAVEERNFMPLGNQKVYHRHNKILPSNKHLKQLNSDQIFTTYICKKHINIIHPYIYLDLESRHLQPKCFVQLLLSSRL
jgi:hypothetical protein